MPLFWEDLRRSCLSRVTELRTVIQFDVESLDSILVLPFFFWVFFWGGGLQMEKDILVTIPPSGCKIEEALTALTHQAVYFYC